MSAVFTVIKKIDDQLERLAIWSLVIALMLMIGLSLLNMALRWIDVTFLWVDPVVRYLVFLCGFLGGSVATSANKHIRIDIVPRLLEVYHLNKMAKQIHRLVDLFCIGMLAWLIHASYAFYLIEVEFGKEEFLGIHSSTMVAMVPLGLALVMFRFFAQLVLSFQPHKS